MELRIADHTGVNKSATDLVAELTVTPQGNPTSQSLKPGGDKNLALLRTLKGAAFDIGTFHPTRKALLRVQS
jgi:putative membrane protein